MLLSWEFINFTANVLIRLDDQKLRGGRSLVMPLPPSLLAAI